MSKQSINNPFLDYFQKELNNPPPVGMVMKYNALRIDSTIRRFVFVEGSSDSRFYGNSNVKELSDSTAYIFQAYEEGNGGKEAVFYACGAIRKDAALMDSIERCIFIVDHDWDNNIKSKNGYISKKESKDITVTLGHSMECYFLEQENVEKIFTLLNVQKYVTDFRNIQQNFVEETCRFWALKGTIQYAISHDVKGFYKKVYSFNDIFSFDFDGPEYFRKDLMQAENEKMELWIGNDSNLLRYCDKLCELIREQPRYIRGHDYFNLLKTYLCQKCNLSITDKNLYDLCPQLFVDIDIKRITK